MKVLHINTGQEGGAAWCARRISNALGQQGVDCRMLLASGSNMPDGIEGAIAEKDKPSLLYTNWLLARFRYHILMHLPGYLNKERLQTKLYQSNINHLYLHQPLSEYTNIARHPLVEWADIIHLHWVPDFVDYPTFFKNVKKPIVWTLHDKYPAVGVQHYCSDFFPVPESLKGINKLCIKIKRKGVSEATNLHLVAISEMVKKICEESDVLRNIPCSLIHNGVETEVFKPWNVNKNDLFAKYSMVLIPTNATIFMFSAFGIWDKNKGLKRVIDALEKVDCGNKVLLVVGNNSQEEKPTASFPVICTGLIRDQNELARLYSSVDYFILASYEETFAQTPLEAMACGKPVISTPCSGASDLIRSFNGVICNGYNSAAIADGITKALSTQYDSSKICQYILENYKYSKIAMEYIELYEQVLLSKDNS